MVTDQQVRRLMKLMKTENTLGLAAANSGMDEKTARKYINLGKLPSDLEATHTWRTRKDPFEEVWEEIECFLETNSGLESKTIFVYLQREYPGKFMDGQLRTLQRRIKIWKALEGPGKEVFFPQIHKPGHISESDFTDMSKLGITIQKEPFDHLLYHFVLTYSNWETGTICFSESYESLSEGLQNSIWELGGVPKYHQTDRLSAAVHKVGHPEEFTKRYSDLLSHYSLRGKKIQAGKANENGDVEQSHFRYKKAVDQALMLRGSRDFNSREDYNNFLKDLFNQLNSGRQKRFKEELKELSLLPNRRHDSSQKISLKVGPSSTVCIHHNVYSVHSRLIGERIEIVINAEKLDLWYAQKLIETIPRVRGEYKSCIQYRHIIDWLIRKPGAFENYRYREDLFPTSRFRVAYDYLKDHIPSQAAKEYLKILYMAARESEDMVDDALRYLINNSKDIKASVIEKIMQSKQVIPPVTDVSVAAVNLYIYDELLHFKEEVAHA